MARLFISLGSNIRPARNIRRAIRYLSKYLRVNSISTVYCTAPEERPGQPFYFNCVLDAESEAPPENLKFGVFRNIEKDMGRIRTGDKYAPRTIDIDIIAYGDLVLQTDRMTLPDPRIMSRPFLAIPLFELAPEFIIPGTKISIKQAASALSANNMKALPKYTALIRKEAVHGYRESQRTC